MKKLTTLFSIKMIKLLLMIFRFSQNLEMAPGQISSAKILQKTKSNRENQKIMLKSMNFS